MLPIHYYSPDFPHHSHIYSVKMSSIVALFNSDSISRFITADCFESTGTRYISLKQQASDAKVDELDDEDRTIATTKPKNMKILIRLMWGIMRIAREC